MNKKQIISAILVILIPIVAIGGFYYLKSNYQPSSYEDCRDHGGAILESYPEQCTLNGNTFANPDQSAALAAYSRFTHPVYGFSIGYPSDWKLGTYTSRTSADLQGNTVLNIALDPKHVGNQEEFQTLDKPMGTVMVSLGDVPAASFTQGSNKTIFNGLTFYTSEQIHGTNDVSNPYFQNKTERSYYFEIPESSRTDGYQTLTVWMVYPNTESSDAAFQTTLDTILKSVSFSAGTREASSVYQSARYNLKFTYPPILGLVYEKEQSNTDSAQPNCTGYTVFGTFSNSQDIEFVAISEDYKRCHDGGGWIFDLTESEFLKQYTVLGTVTTGIPNKKAYLFLDDSWTDPTAANPAAVIWKPNDQLGGIYFKTRGKTEASMSSELLNMTLTNILESFTTIN